jgi:hypothetical protein
MPISATWDRCGNQRHPHRHAGEASRHVIAPWRFVRSAIPSSTLAARPRQQHLLDWRGYFPNARHVGQLVRFSSGPSKSGRAVRSEKLHALSLTRGVGHILLQLLFAELFCGTMLGMVMLAFSQSSLCVRKVRSGPRKRLNGVSLSKALPVAGRSTRARARPRRHVPDACSQPAAIDKASAR